MWVIVYSRLYGASCRNAQIFIDSIPISLCMRGICAKILKNLQFILCTIDWKAVEAQHVSCDLTYAVVVLLSHLIMQLTVILQPAITCNIDGYTYQCYMYCNNESCWKQIARVSSNEPFGGQTTECFNMPW